MYVHYIMEPFDEKKVNTISVKTILKMNIRDLEKINPYYLDKNIDFSALGTDPVRHNLIRKALKRKDDVKQKLPALLMESFNEKATRRMRAEYMIQNYKYSPDRMDNRTVRRATPPRKTQRKSKSPEKKENTFSLPNQEYSLPTVENLRETMPKKEIIEFYHAIIDKRNASVEDIVFAQMELKKAENMIDLPLAPKHTIGEGGGKKKKSKTRKRKRKRKN